MLQGRVTAQDVYLGGDARGAATSRGAAGGYLREHTPLAGARAEGRAVPFPAIEPYDRGWLAVGDGHAVYYEQSGNPFGKPAVVLHGGPGGGIAPAYRQFHDPGVYRVVVLDQRGAGRSTPPASIEANTTWALVADLERLRAHLGVARWQVFGGSWGSTLALAYAEAHPGKVTELIVRGIFLCRRAEVAWLYQDGASRLFPDRWEQFLAPIPPGERAAPPEGIGLVEAYHRRLNCGDSGVEMEAARAWARWEDCVGSLVPPAPTAAAAAAEAAEVASGLGKTLAVARIENHYFKHGGFFEPESQLLDNLDAIRHIPAVIVQGRYDVVCPAASAWELHRAWPEADFVMVQDSGHSWSEPGTTHELLTATARFSGVGPSGHAAGGGDVGGGEGGGGGGGASLSPADMARYYQDGFVVLRGAVPAARVASVLAAVRDYAASAADFAEEPAGGSSGGLDDLLHPAKYRPAFGDYLAQELVARADPLVGGAGRHSMFGMLGHGGGAAVAQGWHGGLSHVGLVRPSFVEGEHGASATEELAYLAGAAGLATQMNAPLLAGDRYMQVVPGSHCRASTPAELAVLRAERAGVLAAVMPGAVAVELEPGDVCFYDPNIYHRGYNPGGEPRWTMHALFLAKRCPVASFEAGQRAALLAPGHIPRLPIAAARYLHRYCSATPMEPPPLREIVLGRYPLVPGHTEDAPPRMLTEAQQRFFQTFGFIHLKGLLADDIGWVQQEFEAAWRSHEAQWGRPHGHSGQGRTIWPGCFVHATPRLSTLIEHPAIRGICLSTLGEGYTHEGGDGNFYTGDTGWHSDCGVEWEQKSLVPCLKIAFYLDELTADSGAVRLIPGSYHHRDVYMSALHNGLQMGKGTSEELLGVPGKDVPAHIVESTPGDLVCFDHRCKHAAFGGGPSRRMFTMNWYAATPTEAHKTAAKLVNGMPRARGQDDVDNYIDRSWRDSEPRGFYEASPPERQRIIRNHRTLWAEAVREIDAAPDGLAAFGKVTAEELGAGLVAHLDGVAAAQDASIARL
jgi:proline iminopeptidase